MLLIGRIRNHLWNLLGIGAKHIQWVSDNHYLKEDAFTRIGYRSYDNNAIVYRWSDAPLIIGKYCSISYGVKFVLDDGKHTYNQVTNYPFKDNEISSKQGIVIGNDVWIGLNAIILNGVIIGNGATIAAGAVVTHDVPDYCVVAGIPAKIIKRKCTEDEAEIMNQIGWWDWKEEQIQRSLPDFKEDIPSFIAKYRN